VRTEHPLPATDSDDATDGEIFGFLDGVPAWRTGHGAPEPERS
jgi:hypothetical protein